MRPLTLPHYMAQDAMAVFSHGRARRLHHEAFGKEDRLVGPSNRVVSGMPASVHFLSPTPLLLSPANATAAMPDSRHKLRNAGRVFATNRETRNLCGEIRLKQACGRS